MINNTLCPQLYALRPLPLALSPQPSALGSLPNGPLLSAGSPLPRALCEVSDE